MTCACLGVQTPSLIFQTRKLFNMDRVSVGDYLIVGVCVCVCSLLPAHQGVVTQTLLGY